MKLSGLLTLDQRKLIGRVGGKLRGSLSHLTGRRADLARQIEAHRAAVLEVERSLALCDRAESAIEEHLSALDLRAVEFSCIDGRVFFHREFEAREALLRLRRDLPSIRAHWRRMRAALVGDETPSSDGNAAGDGAARKESGRGTRSASAPSPAVPSKA